MIFIPGALISAITFPGVILHEIAHKFFCDLYRVPVYEVNYFAVSKIAGHVIHAPAADPRKNVIIGLAPLMINSVVCFLFLLPELFPIFTRTSFVSTYTLLDIFLIWIGFSCGFNALPSEADLAHIDKNASWELVFIRRLVQIFNFCGIIGIFSWFMIIIFVPFVTFSSIFLLISFFC